MKNVLLFVNLFSGGFALWLLVICFVSPCPLIFFGSEANTLFYTTLTSTQALNLGGSTENSF